MKKSFKILNLAGFFLILLFSAAYAFADTAESESLLSAMTRGDKAMGCGGRHNCVECHKFDGDKFKSLVGNKDLQILSAAVSGGLWEVVFNDRGRNDIAYMTMKGDGFFANARFIKDGRDVTRQTLLKHSPKADFSKIPLSDAAVVMGSREAKNKIVVFDDLDCPFCGKLHFELKRLIAEYPEDYAVYLMLYPLPGHGKAREKSEFVVCVKDEAERGVLIDKLFADLLEGKGNASVPKASCDNFGVIDMAFKFGSEELKINGTPVFILPDGRLIQGYMDYEALKELLGR